MGERGGGVEERIHSKLNKNWNFYEKYIYKQTNYDVQYNLKRCPIDLLLPI